MVTTTTATSNASMGSQIISSLGSGSGININDLANNLTDAAMKVQADKLTSRQTLLETQISDYGMLRSSLAKLQTAAAALGSADTFNAKALSVPNTSLVTFTALNASAAAGNYQLKVEQVAQSQSLSSAMFDSLNAPIGKGELNIRLGSWAGGNFAVDASKTGDTITIDDSNNSLAGLRDAINKSDLGVNASIVKEGEGYKLLITAKSGATNELEITATDAEGSTGLAAFNFNNTEKALTQEQAGQDAILRVNGLEVKRESNRINDVIEGLEFDVFSASATEVISLNITADKSTAEQTIRDFVAAYNTFLQETAKLIGFDAEKEADGSLVSDPLAKNLMRTIRNTLTSQVPGLGEGFSSLGSIGIRTKTDGSLEIIEKIEEINTNFRAAIDNNFEAVRDLFVPKVHSDSAQVVVSKYTGASQPGTYEVVITQDPEKGGLIAGEIAQEALELNGEYAFTLRVDTVETNTILLPQKTYATGAELAKELQSLINMDEKVKAAYLGVTVSFDEAAGKLVFASNAYGASSIVSIVQANENMESLGLGVQDGSAGKDVIGTVNGVAAFGSGNVLLPALGTPAEGLSMIIEPGAKDKGATNITFSRGLAGGLTGVVDGYLKTSGLITERETNIGNDIKRVKNDQESLTRRTEAYRARLMAQFQAMEAIVRSLNSTGSFLDGLVDRLPFTAKSS